MTSDAMQPAPLQPRLSRIQLASRLPRGLWLLVWLLLFRPSPVIFHGWRRLLLRMFGSRIGQGAHIYPTARIWAPWNLIMGEGSCLAEGVDCYNVMPVTLGNRALVSQRAFLCTASHDYDDPRMALVGAPILLEADSWVTSEVFVAPGVTLGEGAVALARSVVTRDVAPWTVVAGHPAREVRKRRRTGDKQ